MTGSEKYKIGKNSVKTFKLAISHGSSIHHAISHAHEETRSTLSTLGITSNYEFRRSSHALSSQMHGAVSDSRMKH